MSIEKPQENSLNTLPNIGKVLSDRLKQVDIKTAEELKALGSENAFIRLLTVDPTSCLHEFFALEGAVQGIRWHNLDEARKDELRVFHKLCKAQSEKKS